MFRYLKTLMLTALMLTVTAPMAMSQQDDYQYDHDQGMLEPRIDRYLDVDVWTNHTDGEYFEGDNVVIKFRVNQDAFVAIYTIDSRDRVNLLFPTGRDDDNFVRGGVTYRIPDGLDDFDLVVTGPEGVENIQIIASRERFPIPQWYGQSGVVFDWDDRHEFMDFLNRRHFVRYDGQRFAYDRTAMYVNDWEPTYFRPVYYPSYPSWTVCGNVYLDYPWGSSVYVDGIYWGCTPLYVPRIYVGWHTFTVYDRWGSCWESDLHVTRYHTVVLDRTIVNPRTNVYSKYKDVRFAGYQDPVSSGYPKYKDRVVKMKVTAGVSSSGKIIVNNKTKVSSDTYIAATNKKYVRGSAKVVKTERGYETTGTVTTSRSKSRESSSARARSSEKSSGSVSKSSRSSGSSGYSTSKSSSGSSRSATSSRYRTSQGESKSSSATKTENRYRKKSTGQQKASPSSRVKSATKSSKSSGSSQRVKSSKQSKSGSSKSSGKVKSSSSKSKSSSESKSTGGGKKTSKKRK